jgi:DNA-binding XRE family transcriptional regulator
MNYNQISKQSNLTGSDVLDIRRLHDEDGLNDAQLARQFSVSRKAIYNIVERNTWKDVPDPALVRGFTGYSVYPDGRVFSNIRRSFLTPIQRSTGEAVRITAKDGSRKTVSVSTLLKQAGYYTTA